MYAHTVSVPAGERVGSALFIWPMSTNGWAGIRSCARSAAYAVKPSMLSHRWTVPARVAASARHGIGPDSAQSTLNVPGPTGSGSSGADHLRGQVLLAHEVAVERGRADVGEHAAGAAIVSPSASTTATARPVAHLDAGDRRVAADLAAARGEPPNERGGELSRAALGHGEAVLLTEAGEEPSEEPARRDVGTEVAVHARCR